MKQTLIAIPCMDQCASQFMISLANLDRDGIGKVMCGAEINTLVHMARNSFARMAINAGVDYVMWFDSDMVFPPDTLKRMIAHMEDGLDIVSGIYFKRRPPFSPVLYKRISTEPAEDGTYWEEYSDYPKDSLFEIAACGFGCVMCRTSVLLDVQLNEPGMFNMIGSFGEDISFCIRARNLGYKIWCDSSIKCGHVGHLVVDESAYEAMR